MIVHQQRIDLHALEAALPLGRVVTDPVALITYEGDASLDKGHPDAVVFPHSTDEVIKIIQWAGRQGVPLVARGAGTGLSGGAVAEHGGIILQFSAMDRVLDLDAVGRSAVAQPGAVNLVLDGLVKAKGLYYPPDPSSGRTSTISGNIGENAGGPHCFKYGVTSNYVTGLEVVLADGRTVRLGGRALDYPEYDLVALLVGSEGTLGVVTEASVRLVRNPPAVKTLMAAFDSVESAGEAVSAVIANGLVPATLEMMDQRIMRIIEDFTHAGLPVESGAALIVEVDGYPQSTTPQMDEISAILLAHQAYNLRIAQTAEERDKIWYARKSAAGAMARLAPAYYLVDGTVPRSKLAQTLTAVNGICDDLELRVGYVFHAGDGNLHPLILIEDPADKELIKRVIEAGRRILELCVQHEGSITGEHGVGIEKRAFMPLMFTPTELAVLKEVKEVFDPANLLNPYKIFPEQAEYQGAISNGRVAEIVATPPIDPLASPATLNELVQTVQSCRAAGVPFQIRGGSATSGALPLASVTIATESLRGISKLALEDLYVTAGAGTPLSELQAELVQHKMWTPLVSPWPAATLGGIVATNMNAPLRMRYGGVRDQILAATVVLPDGRSIRAGRPVVKNVAGYDLPKLLVGSHGTLGIIADVTLKLTPLPRSCTSLVIPLRDLGQGLDLGMELLQTCLMASALLLCRGVDIPGVAAPYALVYTAEGMAEDVAAELTQVRDIVQEKPGGGAILVDLEGSAVWATWLRDVAATSLLARVGVAVKDLPRLLRDLNPTMSDASFVADLASGLLYTQGVAIAPMRREAHRLGGYAVVLNAPGPEHDALDIWGYQPASLDLMRRLKARWDPDGLCNPGAFLV
jgi:D-lactate dehydrogenase (cytochrome)